MKKYILHWWIYPSSVVCLCAICFYAAWFISWAFLFGAVDGIGESLLELPSAISYLLAPLIFISIYSLLFVGMGTLAFYLSDLRLQSYLQHNHQFPVFSATIIFGLVSIATSVALVSSVISIDTWTENAIDALDTTIYNMVDTGMDRSADTADRLLVNNALDTHLSLVDVRNLIDPVLGVLSVQYPIALILYVLQARKIAEDYRKTTS